MKRVRTMAVWAAMTLAPVAAFAAEPVEWTLDPGHSQVGFTARHLGFTKVRGEFKEFTANAKGDAETGKLTSVEATAQTKSVDTGITKRDDHLRSDDFFNAEKFPTMKLKSKSIKWDGNKFTAVADLTIRDVTKPVTFTGEMLGLQKVNLGQGPQLRASYEASGKVNRKEFGLKFAAVAEGVAVVADEITIQFEAVFYRPAAQQAKATK